MMKTIIWKYQLVITDDQFIEVPEEFRILSIQIQNEIPYIWIAVNPKAPKRSIKIVTFGTGHSSNEIDSLDFIGTYQLPARGLVFHVFVDWN